MGEEDTHVDIVKEFPLYARGRVWLSRSAHVVAGVRAFLSDGAGLSRGNVVFPKMCPKAFIQKKKKNNG